MRRGDELPITGDECELMGAGGGGDDAIGGITVEIRNALAGNSWVSAVGRMILPVLRGEGRFRRVVVVCELDAAGEYTHPIAQALCLGLLGEAITGLADHRDRPAVAGDLERDASGFDFTQRVGAMGLEFAHGKCLRR